MNPLHHPLRFQPYFRPMAWGGRALGRFLGKNLPGTGPIGEAWEVSDHRSHVSVLATGALHGATLRQLMQTRRRELLGAAADRHDVFPWLIKLLDAHDWLSVQVHPNAAQVQRWLPGEGPKSEAWLVLGAQPGSLIYAGLRPGVGPAEFRLGLEQGTVADCLHRFEPKPGDILFLEAGTVHAVGGGVLLAEIQQTSDATFRLFDWDRRDAHGRPRDLHIDAGLACIDWQRGPVEPLSAPTLTTPYFDLATLDHDEPFSLGGDRRLRALIVAAGQARLDNGEFILAGDAWILPAALPATTFRPEGRLHGLVATLPFDEPRP